MTRWLARRAFPCDGPGPLAAAAGAAESRTALVVGNDSDPDIVAAKRCIAVVESIACGVADNRFRAARWPS